ncbi:MAG TPA: hypothetical protein VF712_12500 [Thermoleophilaceae bacterium]
MLDVVFDAFMATGEWPDPVQLQRETRASGGPRAVARVVTEMPRQLGWREWSPQRAVLTHFGVACCRRARPLLDAYFAVLALALERHSNPDVENRVKREDVDDLVDDEVLADRLSRLIVADHPFLSSGSVGVANWDLEIDERVVEYEEARDVDEFLAILAEQRGVRPDLERTESARGVEETPAQPEQPTQVGAPVSATPAETRASIGSAATSRLLTVVTIIGTVLAIAVAPAPLAVGGVVACVTAVGLEVLRPGTSATFAALIILAAASLGALIGLLVVNGEDDPPAIAAQLDDVVAKADDAGQYPAVQRAARLHPGASGSHLLVLRDQSQRPGGIPHELASPPSDEIRVYDDVDGRLELRIRFHPQNFGEVQQGPDGDAPGYQFRLLSIADLDKNGTAEILGSFDRISNASGPFPLPVLISWDEDVSRYRMDALFTQPPDLRVPRGLPAAALDGYRKPSVVRDQFSDTELTGYPADVVEVRQALRGPVVLAGYAEQSPVGFSGRYEAKGWFLDLKGGAPRLTECTPPGHVLLRIETPAEVPDGLARALIGAPNKRGCGQA